jgi:MFS family permease
MSHREPWNVVRILAFTQISSWGAVYYAITILAPGIGRELGWRPEIVFGAYSWSLLVAGLASTPVGVLLDRYSGRMVMSAGSAMAGIGLIALANTHSIAVYFAAWTLLGVAMAATLYEAAFATINREFPLSPRKAISTLTLFGGLASTVFWPLSLKLETQFGWRGTYMLYGALHLLVCLPLHLLLHATPAQPRAVESRRIAGNYTLHEAVGHPAFWKLAFAFAANSFVFAALTVHLIPTLQRFGHSTGTAVLVSTFIGPMQVAGRIGEMALAHRIAPTAVGRFTFGALPAALLALILFGEHELATAAFCVLYGLSNGIMTIVKGTIPQELFGRENYGAISGAMSGPSMVARAAGPLAIAALVAVLPSPLWLLGTLFAVAMASLLCYLAAIRVPHATAALASQAE